MHVCCFLTTIFGLLFIFKFIESLHLNGNAFSGTVPSEMGSLSILQELQLHSNRLIGTIPEEIGNLVDISKWKF